MGGDAKVAHDAVNVFIPGGVNERPGGHKARRALFRRHALQASQQVTQPGLIVHIVGKETAPAPGLEAGFAVQGINFQAGVIAKDERPLG